MNARRGKGLGLAVFSAFSMVMLAGCAQSKPSNRPKTVAVQGIVTYQGTPVEGATVMFVPQDAKGKGAVGKTDKSGEFRLTTFEAGDGALPGSYRVAISKTTSKSRLTEEQEKRYLEKDKPFRPNVETDELPVKYKKAAGSGLTADVKEKGDNTFQFDLTG